MADAPTPLPWWKSLASENNGQGSAPYALLWLVVLAALGLCTYEVMKHGFKEVKDFMIWLCTAMGLLQGHNRREERLEATSAKPPGPPSAPAPPPGPGSPP